MRRLVNAAMIAAVATASGWAAVAERDVPTHVPPAAPPPECEARVGYDRDAILPGYLLPTAAGPRTCIPFTTVAAFPPPGYRGDFYVDAFSDARLRERWQACKNDKVCRDRVFKQVTARQPPNKEYHLTAPRARYLLGKVDEPAKGALDLVKVRRPAFFARAPYREVIAGLDARTFTVEFTAPRDAYERLHQGMTDPVKLRGWYIRGDGVEGGRGGTRRALIVMTGGGGGRIAAIEDPADTLYRTEPSGETKLNNYPNDTTGATGQALWRETATELNRAGFDVLLHDRRGVGISSGFSDTNTLQQGRDLLAMIAALRTGRGLRARTPAGDTRTGIAAVAAVRGGKPGADLPVLLFGSSRGSMSSGWAMTMNFDRNCTYDLPTITCRPPVRDPNIKGAILLSEFTSGAGYVSANTSVEDEARGLGRDRGLFIGGSEVENNIVFFPSSAILAGMHRWPAAFFARGLWDYAAALQGTLDGYSRVPGPKELVVVRGPHPYETWPEVEKRRVMDRIVAFSRAVIRGKTSVPGGRPWTDMKTLVATTSDAWEPSTRPTVR